MHAIAVMTFWPSLFSLPASHVNRIDVYLSIGLFQVYLLREVMPMRPYPPSNKPGSAEQSLLRLLGGVLAFLSLLLTLLGIILHQRAADLILASIVGIFALRVLVLWLGDTPH